jgi:hypothetical protein
MIKFIDDYTCSLSCAHRRNNGYCELMQQFVGTDRPEPCRTLSKETSDQQPEKRDATW